MSKTLFQKLEDIKDNIDTFGFLEGVKTSVEDDLEEFDNKEEYPTSLFLKQNRNICERELRAGDVIAVSRKLPYQHFAVYIGNNRVVHFAAKDGDWAGKPTIHEAPFEDFLRDSDGYEIIDFDEQTQERQVYKGKLPGIENAIESANLIPIANILLEIVKCMKSEEFHLYTPEETVERAKRVARECSSEGTMEEIINGHRYNLVFNNCEHFAIWCKTGVHESQQVEKILRVLDFCMQRIDVR